MLQKEKLIFMLKDAETLQIIATLSPNPPPPRSSPPPPAKENVPPTPHPTHQWIALFPTECTKQILCGGLSIRKFPFISACNNLIADKYVSNVHKTAAKTQTKPYSHKQNRKWQTNAQ